MQKLTHIVQEFVLHEGACLAGIATAETLAGGPPSSELTYVLPEAQAAVCFGVAIDQQVIVPYLQKQDRLGLERAIIKANAVASGISFHLANFLGQRGFPSVPVAANNVFRPQDPTLSSDYIGDNYYPDIAHRYLAVRSGIGHLGLSGNLITKKHGAAVILATTVTSARLHPTEPLPDRENYCDNCRLCMAACAAGFMDRKEKTKLSLGGHSISYAKRRNYGRCDLVCSGYTGLHPSGRWSTWSPGRFAIPDSDEDLSSAYKRQQHAHSRWPREQGGRYFFFMDDKLRIACANCQLICCPDKDERKARYNILAGSGVILQDSDGRRRAVSPEKACQAFASMPAWQKRLYQDE